ncbi:MAG: hypothetical protein GWO26_25030 [Phycisphaerae bacterium]|nr:hypothetical protein [Phycisphaerae bacterium]
MCITRLPKPIRWFINRIDDPFDNFKHWWYGYHKWFGVWFKCTAYMKNKPGTRWSIKRVDGPKEG